MNMTTYRDPTQQEFYSLSLEVHRYSGILNGNIPQDILTRLSELRKKIGLVKSQVILKQMRKDSLHDSNGKVKIRAKLHGRKLANSLNNGRAPDTTYTAPQHIPS